MYDSVDYNNLRFEYAGPTNDVSFYEYMDSKELFNAIKNNQIKFGDNLENFYNSREGVINFFRDYIEMLSDANYYAKQDETKGTGLKILTPEQML